MEPRKKSRGVNIQTWEKKLMRKYEAKEKKVEKKIY